jgi:hypothetical protein
MPIKLVCRNPFHGYERGQVVLDPDAVAEFLNDRENHFVKVEYTEADHAELHELRMAAKADADEAMAKAAANLKPPPEKHAEPHAKGRHGK